MHRLGEYKLVPDIEAELGPKLERSHTHSADSSYHLELQVNDYFPGLSGHGYHSGFDIFSPVPPQYNTPPGSSSSMAFGVYDFSFMFRTPPPTTKEDVDHRDHPQHERQPRRNIPLGP
ncbi:hypothetical protein Gotur_028384, partial [Gossypium turneri]